MTSAAEIESWAVELLLQFQQRSRAEPNLVPHIIPGSLDLGSPCQIQGFGFSFPDLQAFVVTHSRAAKDGQVQGFGDLRPWTCRDAFELALTNFLWSDLVEEDPQDWSWEPDEPDATLRSVGEKIFLGLESHVRFWCTQPPLDKPDPYYSGGQQGAGCLLMIHRGSLQHLSPKKLVESVFRDAKSRFEYVPQEPAPASPPSIPYTAPEFDGRGAHTPVPMRVGKLPDRRLRTLSWVENANPGIEVLRDRLGPYDLIVTHNCFLGLVVANTQEALRWLNLAMAGFLAEGYPAGIIRENDVAKFHVPKTSEPSIGWGGTFPPNPRGRSSGFGWDAHWLRDEQLKACLRRAEKIAQLPYEKHVPFLLEAHSHIQHDEPSQSLLFSWAIIEQEVAARWENFLNGKQVTGSRRDKLTNTAFWPLDQLVENLDLAAQLDHQAYSQLQAVKKVRNQTMHGSRLATLGEAKQALLAAESLAVGDDLRIFATPKKTKAEEQVFRNTL